MLIELAERGLLPDAAIRVGIRRLLRARLRGESAAASASTEPRVDRMRALFAAGPIADHTADSRRQHYEAPTELFQQMLGPRLKYSSCLWSDGCRTLADAEEAMLTLTAERAGIADGQRILDLGCGWGSFSLWAAERYPNAQIVAVSHSHTQHEYIEAEARARGLRNVRHIVADVSSNDFIGSLVAATASLAPAPPAFDRIVSIEMFEHLHNVDRLLHLLANWLAPDGRLFVHIFCHRELFYRYQDAGASDWMARHFFTGGAMPPLDLFAHVHGPFQLVERWEVGGEHYARTCQAWLQNLDRGRDAIVERFQQELERGPVPRRGTQPRPPAGGSSRNAKRRATPGQSPGLNRYDETSGGLAPAEARRQLQRWRLFIMACAELFAYDGGHEWLVSHHLLQPHPQA